MNYFEIKPNGEAYIRTDSGTVIRKVGDGESVNYADFNKDETLFVITYVSGRCEIRDRKNKLMKVVAEEGVEKALWDRSVKETAYQVLETVSFGDEKILLVMKR